MKRVVILMFVVVFTLSMVTGLLVGCKTTTATETTMAAETTAAATTAAATTAAATTAAETTAAKVPFFTYATVKTSGSPFNVEHWNAFEQTCKDRGIKATMYDCGKHNVELHIQQMEEAILLKPDVFLFQVVDQIADIPAAKKAFDAGLKVVCTVGAIAEEGWPYLTAFTGAGQIAQGQTAAEMMVQGMEEKFGKDLTGKKVVILLGQIGHPATVERTKGFEDRLKELAPGVEILDKQTCDWDKAKGIIVMESFLTKFPQIDGVFGNNDGGALGALQAADAKGRLKDMIIIGVDGVAEALEQIKAGNMYGTVNQSPALLAKVSVDVAEKIYKGEEVPFTNLIENEKIMKSNIDQYLK